MQVLDYAEFVRKTDQYADKPRSKRSAIALYGLVGEIGSLVSAVKKKLLSEDGESEWNRPNEEIMEEIGDTLWYVFSLAQIENDTTIDILVNDIALLRRKVGGKNERAQKIRTALDASTKNTFLEAAQLFPPDKYCFDDYQRLAFMTAHTDGQVLLEVCLAVLWQLGAKLLRSKLPEIELTLNKNVADRPANIALGEIAWHLCVVASIYRLSMDDVVKFNCDKVRFRSERSAPTPLHDDDRSSNEQFPRIFDVSFVPAGPNESRMYFEGKQLGDDLTDNAYENDGYRFHDIFHLAFIAHLGWSPVVRAFMNRKRKSQNDRVDEVEDGARAKLVEELVIKAIHSEGELQAKLAGTRKASEPYLLFPNRNHITFKLLKALRSYVVGLEVWENAYWEWEDAILEGCDAFFQLRKNMQGTVSVDLTRRKLTYSPQVSTTLRSEL